MSGRAHEICIGRINLHACGIGVVVEKLMQPEFHHESAQAFGRRRGNLRLELGECLLRCDEVFFLGRSLHAFEGLEPLHE